MLWWAGITMLFSCSLFFGGGGGQPYKYCTLQYLVFTYRVKCHITLKVAKVTSVEGHIVWPWVVTVQDIVRMRPAQKVCPGYPVVLGVPFYGNDLAFSTNCNRHSLLFMLHYAFHATVGRAVLHSYFSDVHVLHTQAGQHQCRCAWATTSFQYSVSCLHHNLSKCSTQYLKMIHNYLWYVYFIECNFYLNYHLAVR